MNINLSIQKYILLITGFLCLYTSTSAQDPQVLRVSRIFEDGRMTETLQRNGDHFYAIIENRDNSESSRYLTDDLEIDSFVHIAIPDSNGFVQTSDQSKVILDYKIGEGFVNYDYISNPGNLSGGYQHTGGFYKNDSIIAMESVSTHCTLNGKTYVPEVLPETAEYECYIAVINYVTDSLMFWTKASEASRIETDMMTVDGDYLYVVTRTNEDTFEFMGEFFPEVIDPNWNVKHIHKINWRTGVKEWSRQFSTDIDKDHLFDIKVIEDGNLVIATKMSGRTYWDGVPIPENTVYDTGYAFFKITPDGDLIDYIQSTCNCKGFHKIQIEEDGSLMLHGAQRNMPNITLGDVEIEKYSEDGIAIFGYVPPNWENPWMKLYQSSHAAVVIGGGLTLDNLVVPFIIFKESIDVEGHIFESEDIGLFEDGGDGRAENVLITYNPDGTMHDDPISIPLDARIYEIIEVSEDHFLFYVKEESNSISTIYGTKLDDFNNSNFMILEVEGDLFDIINNLDDLLKPYLFKPNVYPNPAMSGREITVEYKAENTGPVSLHLVDNSGRMIPVEYYHNSKEDIQITLPEIPSGVYTLHFTIGVNNTQTKIYIK